MSNQADDLDIRLGSRPVDVTHALADNRRTFFHLHLGYVIGQVEEFFTGIRRLAIARQQAPANQGHVGDADHGTGQTDRREIEHAIRLTQRIAAKLRNDDIRRPCQSA